MLSPTAAKMRVSMLAPIDQKIEARYCAFTIVVQQLERRCALPADAVSTLRAFDRSDIDPAAGRALPKLVSLKLKS
jgi:hypothetical protein